MKPAYWIGVLALVGAIIGYVAFQSMGWLGTGIGIVIGILIGAVIYSTQTRQKT
jgi:uncharacterized membrane protein (UPF0136 family)